MGKKKPSKAQANPADASKDLGNKAFTAGNYEEAVKHYSEAIDISGADASHVYFANRANAHLNLDNFNLCIEDCN
jgi:hypothetical protein